MKKHIAFLIIFLAVSAPVTFCESVNASQVEVSSIIAASGGSGAEEFHITGAGEPSFSYYFPNSSAAFTAGAPGREGLYILDAANARVKKYNPAGDFNCIIKPQEGCGIKFDELCGIFALASGEVAVHTYRDIYRLDASGKLTGHAAIKGNFDCHKIFSFNGNSFTAYDYKNLKIARLEADFNKKEAAVAESFGPVLFPWPVSDKEFLSAALPTPKSLCVYKYGFGGGAGFPIASLKIEAQEFVSQHKFIGRDGRNNLYLRYFSGISEKIAVISPALKLTDTITLDTGYSSKRSNLLYDECVDAKGIIYTLFIDSDRLIIKKINRPE
ncbi:MAG TPA: hypothetical protein PKW98_03195 [Candidatus Wallbacteria bacterium]|nr:MAG: hypothetical protein BWY32_00185 [bacterium ADurb.Bin243]HOD39351.1 hypothetical protein [Candidatus Wallbacteria bacterium]HPG56802.1 hypothetical protein [Candidatus Wallbacteria bacterium]